MQIETTIITTETAHTFGANFRITTFEQTISAFCDCCPRQQTGTREQLENSGWGFSQGAEFCPNCND